MEERILELNRKNEDLSKQIDYLKENLNNSDMEIDQLKADLRQSKTDLGQSKQKLKDF